MFNKTKKSSITVILNSYNRHDILDEQLNAIKKQSIPVDDIWLWSNRGDSPIQQREDIKAAYSNHNYKYFGRFAFAMLAQTDFVAFFDDDTIPGTDWFKSCLDYMDTHNGILGTTGIKLEKKSYFPHEKIGWNGTKGPNQSIEEVDLIGHAWFLKKEWLKYIWFEEPITWDNGEDIHLSFLAKKYGNIRSYVLPHPEDNKNIWGSLKGDAYGSDENASWKVNRRKHTQLRNKIVKDQIKNGCTPLFLES